VGLPVGMLLSEICKARSYFMTHSQSVCLGIEHPCGTCDQILLPVGMLLSEICKARSYFTTHSQSVSQYVLVSSALVGLATRYYFLSECCCLKFAKLEVTLRLTGSQSVCVGIEHHCGTCEQISLPDGMLLSEIWEGRSYFTTDGQSVSMSWYRAPLWDLRPDITSCRNVTV
jgi:hypothetical protein